MKITLCRQIAQKGHASLLSAPEIKALITVMLPHSGREGEGKAQQSQCSCGLAGSGKFC
jgi:hypothetical protein